MELNTPIGVWECGPMGVRFCVSLKQIRNSNYSQNCTTLDRPGSGGQGILVLKNWEAWGGPAHRERKGSSTEDTCARWQVPSVRNTAPAHLWDIGDGESSKCLGI